MKEASAVKYAVKYSLGATWYTHSEHADMFEAKRAMKTLKKHVGTCGKFKIVKS